MLGVPPLLIFEFPADTASQCKGTLADGAQFIQRLLCSEETVGWAEPDHWAAKFERLSTGVQISVCTGKWVQSSPELIRSF